MVLDRFGRINREEGVADLCLITMWLPVPGTGLLRDRLAELPGRHRDCPAPV